MSRVGQGTDSRLGICKLCLADAMRPSINLVQILLELDLQLGTEFGRSVNDGLDELTSRRDDVAGQDLGIADEVAGKNLGFSDERFHNYR